MARCRPRRRRPPTVAEREAIVTACGPAGVQFKPLGSACAGCDTGCGGRCALFDVDGGDLTLPAEAAPAVRVGDRVLLRLDDRSLRRAAHAAYGIALAGLLGGAASGHLLARALGLATDPLTLAGLVAGTWLAVRWSKRRAWQPQVELACAARHPHPEETGNR